MPRKTQEDRVRRTAARVGLKLIKNRYSLTSTGKQTYCLRPFWDAKHVVAIPPTGGIELVSTTSKRRQHVASWLPLNAIENMLPNWGKVLHRANRKPTFVTATAAPRTLGKAQHRSMGRDRLVQEATA